MGQNNKRFLHWAIAFTVALLAVIAAFLLTTGALTAHADEPLEQYGRNGLDALDGETNNLVAAYDLLVTGLTAKSADISMTSVSVLAADTVKILGAVHNDHPEFYYWNGGSSYSIQTISEVSYLYSVRPTYTDLATDDASAAAFEAGIQEVLADARLTAGMDAVEKERALHDALCRKVAYVEDTNAHSAYGALVDGLAVCEGYARAFQLLLNRIGVSSHVVTGMADNGSGTGEAHAWNLVKIGSDYCYTDVTWDDHTTVEDQTDHSIHEEPYDGVFYGYFNISYSMIHEDHFDSITYATLPTSTTDAYSFFNRYPKSGTVVDQTKLSSTLTAADVVNLLKTNTVARLFVTGGAKNTISSNINSWFTTNFGSILSGLGIDELGYTASMRSSGREVHLILKFKEGDKTLESKLTGVQGILSGNLSVRYNASVAAQHAGKLRLRVFNDGEVTVLEPVSVDTYNCYFRYDGLTPHHMGDRLDAELFVYNENGNEPIAISGLNGFTFKDYCNALLNKTAVDLDISDAKKTALDQLLKDLLVYGRAVQVYADYDTSHPIDEGITGASVFTALDSPIRSDTDSTDSTLAKEQYTVWFDCANRISLYYHADNPGTVTALIDGNEATPELVGSWYRIMTADVLATEFDKVFTFELRRNGTAVQTLTFSVQAYVYALQNNLNDTYRNLVQTLYNYGLSCKTYLATPAK